MIILPFINLLGKDARYFHKTTNLIKWPSTMNNSGAVAASTLFMMMACRKRHTSAFGRGFASRARICNIGDLVQS